MAMIAQVGYNLLPNKPIYLPMLVSSTPKSRNIVTSPKNMVMSAEL